ncbi:MAG TPA: class I SAM-dependent methyltransferase [Thermoplasmata archaeon]|nr:class I SAM-dependent methyltransferase [Thermoplasmata archaeon]
MTAPRAPRKAPASRGGKAGTAADEVREIWEANAAFWDERMGEGNATHRLLVSPAMERLLAVRPGETVLEIACGNGQFARRLATLGARVLATDLSEAMLQHARRRTSVDHRGIEYRRLDATDRPALRALGAHRFAAVVCPMALMDIAAIEPLAESLGELLGPGGRFVFAVTHPCFNGSGARRVLEEEDDAGTLVERSGVFVYRYATPTTAKGLAMIGQPRPQLFFDRPLNALLRPFFAAGFALDALEEPLFPAELAPPRPMSWVSFREIPSVLVGRMRRFDGPG